MKKSKPGGRFRGQTSSLSEESGPRNVSRLRTCQRYETKLRLVKGHSRPKIEVHYKGGESSLSKNIYSSASSASGMYECLVIGRLAPKEDNVHPHWRAAKRSCPTSKSANRPSTHRPRSSRADSIGVGSLSPSQITSLIWPVTGAQFVMSPMKDRATGSETCLPGWRCCSWWRFSNNCSYDKIFLEG